MALARALSVAGLVRPVKRRAFCPACLVQLETAPNADVEAARPGVSALLFLAVAAAAWIAVIEQSRVMPTMRMGLGSLESFAIAWVVMMAAMMLPSALPLVFQFVGSAERRPGWQTATAALGFTYLGVWFAFGLGCYVLYTALGMPWPNQGFAGGVVLAVAALYGLTPIKRASEARCRELCALHGPLPFNLLRSAVVSGAKYGLSCIGCSAALMLALLTIGMSNLPWMLILALVVLAYKLAPGAAMPRALVLSAALAAMGVVYAVVG
jgi:predicted metal-binding membrane protein